LAPAYISEKLVGDFIELGLDLHFGSDSWIAFIKDK
jgi:hypothetical protein